MWFTVLFFEDGQKVFLSLLQGHKAGISLISASL